MEKAKSKYKKITNKLLNKSNITRNDTIHYYDDSEKAKRIIKELKNNRITKDSAYKAIEICCDYKKEEINKLLKGLENKEKFKLKNKPLISFVIPTYKRKKELKECIDSILNQTYSNYEIIIVDDNSPDQTDKFVKKEYSKHNNIKYFKNETNKGPSYNRKFGFGKTSGQYIIFCDDDDFYIDSLFLERAISLLDNKKDISLISFCAFCYPEKNKILSPNSLGEEKEYRCEEYLDGFLIKYKKPLSTFTSLFERDNLKQNGIEEMETVDDTLIYMCGLLSGNIIVSNKIIGMYRINQNLSSNIKTSFIIDLLNETYNIKCKIKKLDLNINKDRWWEEKTLSIIGWAFKKRNYSKKEYFKIINFVSSKTNGIKNKLKITKKITKLWINS